MNYCVCQKIYQFLRLEIIQHQISKANRTHSRHKTCSVSISYLEDGMISVIFKLA